jgi:hypothetical protein
MALTLANSSVVLDPHPIQRGKQWHVQGTYPSGYKANILSFETEAEALQARRGVDPVKDVYCGDEAGIGTKRGPAEIARERLLSG